MRKVFSFSLPFEFLVLLSYGEILVTCLTSCQEKYVVKGNTWRYAKEGEFPWMVSLQHVEDASVTHFCGGSLAAPHLVLTACHCLVIHSVFSGTAKPFLTEASSKVVVAGTLNNNRSDPNHFRTVVGISEFIIHPKCQHFNHQDPDDRGGWDYDFGLVVLKKNLTFDGKRFAPFRLFAWNKFDLKKDLDRQMGHHVECVATGWGKRRVRYPNGSLIDDDGHDPRAYWPQMTVLQVKLDDFASCYNILCAFDKAYCEVDHWWRSQLCATTEGQMEVCYGDSGGPLMCGSEKYLFGLVGWGPSCGKYKVPSVYPTIYDGLDFIKRYVSRDHTRLRTMNVGHDSLNCCYNVCNVFLFNNL
ncbi:hypothetical protein GE061_006915 [Apolygus lucorum]|uniref:Peptidase S1 domain-containing protein n=1 Tax=Apolygus lucorum TaxID=248454 RepID=A0A8S9WQ66_APOLU|nr:hypothetical protein GE061_006915 [Apolygus lucorum]